MTKIILARITGNQACIACRLASRQLSHDASIYQSKKNNLTQILHEMKMLNFTHQVHSIDSSSVSNFRRYKQIAEMVKKNFKASKIRKNTWSWGIYSTRNFISDLWPLEDRQKRILLNNFVVFFNECSCNNQLTRISNYQWTWKWSKWSKDRRIIDLYSLWIYCDWKECLNLWL